MVTRVCVIGAGAAGLSSLRHLKSKPHLFQAVAFEQSSKVGGTWVYTENTDKDEYGLPIHSSMYKNLRTNLPKEVMGFPDFPFPKEGPSFIGHEDVCNYLQDYAQHFHLEENIYFKTHVTNVCPVKVKNEEMTWKVSVKDLQTLQSRELDFDAVILCNGMYSVPLYPDVPGIDSFTGKLMHSHVYRSPESFENQRVYCLGAASSGKDISIELSSFSKEVYLGHRKEFLKSPLPDNMHQVSGLKEICGSTLKLEDNTVLYDVDTIIFCTGYQKSYPFLDPECHVNVDEDQVITPLYMHCIHTEYPSLSVLGIPKVVCPFPLFDCQIQFIIAALEGSMKLPSKQEMDQHIKDDFERKIASGLHPRYVHIMSHKQWDYNDTLATLAGFKKLPRVTARLYAEVDEQRKANLTNYRDNNYLIVDENNFQIC